MAENLQPESMSTWMRDVERRLSGLERPKASGNAALQIPQTVAYATPGYDSSFGDYVATSSGTWVSLWAIMIPVPVADAVLVEFNVITNPGGGTSEVRLQSGINAATTDAVALTSADQAVRFRWSVLDMDTYVENGGVLPYRIQVQARYLSGGSQMAVYRPLKIVHGLSIDLDAADDGNGEVI